MSQKKPGFRIAGGGLCAGLGSRWEHHVGFVPPEARRHDTDEGPGSAVQDEVFVQDAGVGAELVYPGFVAHYENGRGAWFVVGGLRDAAVESGQAEEFECAGRDFGSVEALGALASLVEDFDFGGGGDAVENVILRGVIEEFGGG